MSLKELIQAAIPLKPKVPTNMSAPAHGTAPRAAHASSSGTMKAVGGARAASVRVMLLRGCGCGTHAAAPAGHNRDLIGTSRGRS
jgi:hypothetical protein